MSVGRSTLAGMDDPVRDHLAAVRSAKRRADAETLLDLMRRVTAQEPAMWATVVGFGSYHYRYESGREGDAPAAGFAPRAAASTVYLPDGVGAHRDLLDRLGPHTTGVGCLYLKDLGQVDLAVLEEIVRRSYATVTAGTFGHRARESG
jgi:predicted GIY-YIG superfamily endonuclease